MSEEDESAELPEPKERVIETTESPSRRPSGIFRSTSDPLGGLPPLRRRQSFGK